MPIYNVEGVTQTLTLDGTTLAGIYNASITKWNDPAIAALNPGSDICLMHRLPQCIARMAQVPLKSSPMPCPPSAADWKTNVGAGTSVEWPVDKAGNGIGGKGNQGVAAAVQNTPNSIGYVELSYALANKITFANMVNQSRYSSHSQR